MSKPLAFAAAAFVAIGLGATFAYTQFAGGNLEECSATATGSDIGGPFELLDKDGNLVTDADIITEPTLIYFGFTFCPDFCPVDMARNSAAAFRTSMASICAS